MSSVIHTVGRFVRPLLKVVLVLAVVLLIAGKITNWYQFWDDNPERGAAFSKESGRNFGGEPITHLKYLDQGWDAARSLWFYTITQGSDLMPYDFFMVLEQEKSDKLFRAPEHIDGFRYLVQKATFSNPDALPVGMVKDSYKGKEYMGFSCSACHTGQVNYQGTAIRIDGGPTGADMVGFLKALTAALTETRRDPAKRARFVTNVLERDNYDDEKEVLADLDTFILRLTMYNIVNHSDTEYGYARLDAFGRIFNRVLEHVLTREQTEEMLHNFLSDEQVEGVLDGLEGILTTPDRDLIVRRSIKALTSQGMTEEQAVRTLSKAAKDYIFISANAPVSYPFLWDIPQHDFVQWNGIGANAGLGPIGRNTGEVIGVFGTLDWHKKDGILATFMSNLDGKQRVAYDSSVNVRNLRRIEGQLWDLESPQWPEDVLGKLDQEKVDAGEKLFGKYCAACHADIDRASDSRRVIAFMANYKEINTDPTMVENAVSHTGRSGFLRNLYVDAGPGKIMLNEMAPVAGLLTKTTGGVVLTPDPDTFFLKRWLDWLYDLATAYYHNPIEASLKAGDYPPSTTARPYQELEAYKGRPLNGIWATAPYLHNGSVPTLYDLLLPKKKPGDPDSGQYRPDRFRVGSRELDPVKVGFISDGYTAGSEFDTSLKGNHNTGHEYAAGKTAQPDGTVLPALSEEERWQLVEYMKSL